MQKENADFGARIPQVVRNLQKVQYFCLYVTEFAVNCVNFGVLQKVSFTQSARNNMELANISIGFIAWISLGLWVGEIPVAKPPLEML